jgi:hypothetical protein
MLNIYGIEANWFLNKKEFCAFFKIIDECISIYFIIQ